MFDNHTKLCLAFHHVDAFSFYICAGVDSFFGAKSVNF